MAAQGIALAWIHFHSEDLISCREVLLDALTPLGSPGNGVAKSEGAIYLWARLPEGELALGDFTRFVWYQYASHLLCIVSGRMAFDTEGLC